MTIKITQKATNVSWHEGEISRLDRYKILPQTGATIWFTGLSGSGKSTIAVALEKALHSDSILSYRLDGDNVRMGINKNLGFSEEDRKENIRRIGEVCKLFGDSGMIAISSFISPYSEDRNEVRIGESIAQFIFKNLSFLFIGKLRPFKAIKANNVAKAIVIIIENKYKDLYFTSEKLEDFAKI